MSFCGVGVAHYVNIVTDAVGRVAVVASAVNAARGVDVKACRIDGCRGAAGTGNGSVNILCHLVEPCNHYHMLKAEGDGGHPVAIAVNVNNDTVLAYGVDAGEVKVARKCLKVYLCSLLAWATRSRSRMLRLRWCSFSVMPPLRIVIEPPHVTLLWSGISFDTRLAASAAVLQKYAL